MAKTREQHIRLGQYLKDMVFAANDGVVTTFAVVAGVAGAELSRAIVLIIGLANLIADGFSMATGNYLGTKSEQELYIREEAIEKEEIRTIPEKEKDEIRELLEQKGYRGEALEAMVRLISSNEKFWTDFMMHEELELFTPKMESPLRHALATFVAFVVAGVLPLLPYIFIKDGDTFLLSSIGAGAALFAAGALRKFFSKRSWFWSGIEMLFVGGSAAGMAYLVGFLLKSLV